MQAQPTEVYPANRTRLLNALTVATAISMVLTFFLALFYAGTDQAQCNVPRIFYMHVGAFTGGFTAFLITGIPGVACLIPRKPQCDLLAVSALENCLPRMTNTLVTGLTSARPNSH